MENKQVKLFSEEYNLGVLVTLSGACPSLKVHVDNIVITDGVYRGAEITTAIVTPFEDKYKAIALPVELKEGFNKCKIMSRYIMKKAKVVPPQPAVARYQSQYPDERPRYPNPNRDNRRSW